jgi:hypothetical protein
VKYVDTHIMHVIAEDLLLVLSTIHEDMSVPLRRSCLKKGY